MATTCQSISTAASSAYGKRTRSQKLIDDIPYSLSSSCMAPKTTEIKDMDWDRTVPMDPRDPRSLRTQWPCMGNHIPMKWHSNKWGQWTHCSRCALRLEYVPKIGAPANSSALVNPGNVKKALEELQRDLPGHMEPNEELVRVMIEKVIAEERMKTLLAEYQKSWDSAKSKVNKAKEALRSTTSPRSSRTEGYAELRLASPSTSTATWEQVTLRPTPAQEPDYLQYLNEDEKMRLMDLVHQRAQQQAQQAPLPNDTDPENMEPNYEAN